VLAGLVCIGCMVLVLSVCRLCGLGLYRLCMVMVMVMVCVYAVYGHGLYRLLGCVWVGLGLGLYGVCRLCMVISVRLYGLVC
jgi:hypothetical protein